MKVLNVRMNIVIIEWKISDQFIFSEVFVTLKGHKNGFDMTRRL